MDPQAADQASSNEELRATVRRLAAEVERLTVENRELRERLQGKAGGSAGGGGEGSGGKPEADFNRLRHKAQQQRDAKQRRKRARAASGPTVRGRGRRTRRPRFDADETMIRDVDTAELPPDAAANGFVDRRFYGLRLVRHNVLVRRHEYISPSQGRIVASVPEGWSGEFTPDTHVTVNALSLGGMTEPKIRELFADHGVSISAGQINHMLLSTADMLRDEQIASHRAGVENSPVIGIDGTYSSCDGAPMVCHILGNDVFTSMTTTEHKDRVTVMGVIAAAPVGHCVGEHALAHPDLGTTAREVLRRVHEAEPVNQDVDAELAGLSEQLRTKGLDAAKMSRFIERAMPHAGVETIRQIREATAGQWLRTVLMALPLVMLADGGTNYHGILAILQLCWIHMLRPFSLLAECADSQRVLEEGWVLYRRLIAWRTTHNPTEAAAIGAEFDRVFDPIRCVDAVVKRQVTATLAHKEHLLTVLRYPCVPPENNGQERAAKARVRKRDISFGPRSLRGLRAWDTMQSMHGTLRKLGISPALFIADRLTRAGRFPRLDILVKNACLRRYGPTPAEPGGF